MFRLHFPTGDLIIDHRSALAPVRNLHCLDSEDEVRRLLLLALNNPTALDRLRRFWAQWHSESWRVNVIKDRKLIDRVARMTVNGPLAAFVVHDKPALNTTHVAAKLSIGNPALKAPAASGPASAVNVSTMPPGPAGAMPPASATAPVAAGTGMSAYDVASLSSELRFEQVLRRTPPYLPHALRGDFGKLLNSGMRVTTVGVLAIWGKSHALGMDFIVDSLLTVTRIALFGTDLFGVAEKLHEAIEDTLEAREEKDLEEAAKLLGDAVAILGVHNFIAMIAHGATRVVSSPMPGMRAERPPPEAPRATQRLEARPAPKPPADGPPADKDIPAECAFLKKGQLVSGTLAQFDRNRKKAVVGPGKDIKHSFPGDAAPSDATEYEVNIGGQKIKVIAPRTYPAGKNIPAVGEVAKGLGAIPPGQLATIKQVEISPNANPSDAYWAQQYNDPTFESAATGGAGGVTTYATSIKLAQDRIDSNLIHEGGHTYQQELWKDAAKKEQWKAAMTSDPRSPSTYSDNAIEEDFSESMVMYSLSKGTKCEKLAKKMFPGRYKLMDEMMKK